jgi:hypothetical protein
MDAESISEMLVTFYETAWHSISEVICLENVGSSALYLSLEVQFGKNSGL